MKIYLIGNKLDPQDSLPYMLKNTLVSVYPHIRFKEADPNENFIPENNAYIMDTVVGIPHVRYFDSLTDFQTIKPVSLHDFDLLFHLKFLLKLKKISNVRIIAIPARISQSEVLAELRELIDKLVNRTDD